MRKRLLFLVQLLYQQAFFATIQAGPYLILDYTSFHQEMLFHLRKPSSLTAGDDAAGAASENTSTKRLPALVAAAQGAAERIPRRSADGDGVDWNTKEFTLWFQKCSVSVSADCLHTDRRKQPNYNLDF